MKKTMMTVIAAAIALNAGTALAGVDPDVKCQATKNKLVGQYYACRLKADAAAAVKGGASDYSKCISKFGGKWLKSEEVSGNTCPDNVSIPADMEDYLIDQAGEAAAIVGGTQDIPTEPPVPVCGDGTINAAGEHCDGSALGGQTCATFGMYGTGLGCTAGCKVNISNCTECPAGSFPYEGSCWVLGAEGANCNTACAAVGLTYDTATSTVAGSAGTDEDCSALLYALDAPGFGLDSSGDCGAAGGLGCVVWQTYGYRSRCQTPVTDAAALVAEHRRVCGCH
jgi:hypothetical protein